MNLKNTGIKLFVLLAVLLAGNVSAQYILCDVIIHNTSDSSIQYGIRWGIMDSGFPDVQPESASIPPKSSKVLSNSSAWITQRSAWTAAWYINGVVVNVVNGSFRYNSSLTTHIYWGFDEDGNPVEVLPPVPPRPIVEVPIGWPFGDSPSDGVTTPYYMTGNDGEYIYDPATGTWVWDSNWTDPDFVPPAPSSGERWNHGIRPGGPVMSGGADLPEWYLVPNIYAPGAVLDGSTNDVSQMALNNDYWLRELHRQDSTRNAMLSDLRQYVGALDLDVTVNSPVVNVEVPDVNVTVDAPAVTVEVPDVNVTVDFPEFPEFPERIIVDTDSAPEQYVYNGLNPANSEFWPDDDDMSQAWHRPYTGDTAIVNALDSGADGVESNWSLDGGAFGEGGGWFEAWMGGLYRNLVVMVDKLKFSLTAFSDVGKSYSLVVPFRLTSIKSKQTSSKLDQTSITLDWSSYQNIISTFRGFVVFVLWVYAVKDIRDSVSMIFGGH